MVEPYDTPIGTPPSVLVPRPSTGQLVRARFKAWHGERLALVSLFGRDLILPVQRLAEVPAMEGGPAHSVAP